MGAETKLKGTPRIRDNKIRTINAMQNDEHCDEADAKRTKMVHPDGEDVTPGRPFPVDAIINLSATKPDVSTIFNKLVSTANTEVSVLLPATTARFTITVRLQDNSHRAIKLRYSFVATESGTKFKTIQPGNSRVIDGLSFDADKFIYFQLNRIEFGGTIVEIETWKE